MDNGELSLKANYSYFIFEVEALLNANPPAGLVWCAGQSKSKTKACEIELLYFSLLFVVVFLTYQNFCSKHYLITSVVQFVYCTINTVCRTI